MHAFLTGMLVVLIGAAAPAAEEAADKAPASVGHAVVELVARPYRAASGWFQSLRTKLVRGPDKKDEKTGFGGARQVQHESTPPKDSRSLLKALFGRLFGIKKASSLDDSPPPAVIPAEATGLLDFETTPHQAAADKNDGAEPVLDVPPLVIAPRR